MSKDEAWLAGAKKEANMGKNDLLQVGSVSVGEEVEPSNSDSALGSRNISVKPPEGHSGVIQLNIQAQAESQSQRQVQGQLQLMAQLQAQAQAQWQELHQFLLQVAAQIQSQKQDQWQEQLQAQLQFQLQLLILILLDGKGSSERHQLLQEVQELTQKKS